MKPNLVKPKFWFLKIRGAKPSLKRRQKTRKSPCTVKKRQSSAGVDGRCVELGVCAPGQSIISGFAFLALRGEPSLDELPVFSF